MVHFRAPLAAVLAPLALLASGCAMFRPSHPARWWVTLRAVNLAIERAAFHTEFYPTYDFIPVWKGLRTRALSSEPSH